MAKEQMNVNEVAILAI